MLPILFNKGTLMGLQLSVKNNIVVRIWGVIPKTGKSPFCKKVITCAIVSSVGNKLLSRFNRLAIE
jgi:hypothetical protein